MLKSIQDLACLKYEQGSWDLSLIALKQRGLFDFPITIGSSLPPAALTKKAQLTLSLDFFPRCTALTPRQEICLVVLDKIVLSRPCLRHSLGSSG